MHHPNIASQSGLWRELLIPKWVHVTRLRSRLRATDAHLAISPLFKIGDRKALKERVRFNELLSFGSARRICARHG
jgi:hypothetical protein